MCMDNMQRLELGVYLHDVLEDVDGDVLALSQSWWVHIRQAFGLTVQWMPCTVLPSSFGASGRTTLSMTSLYLGIIDGWRRETACPDCDDEPQCGMCVFARATETYVDQLTGVGASPASSRWFVTRQDLCDADASAIVLRACYVLSLALLASLALDLGGCVFEELLSQVSSCPRVSGLNTDVLRRMSEIAWRPLT